MMELSSAAITWVDNHDTVIVPEKIIFQYWDILSGKWEDVVPQGEWTYTGAKPAGAANTYDFAPIITNKIKLIMMNQKQEQDGAKIPTGIYEWALEGNRWVKNLTDLSTAIVAAEAYKNADKTYTENSFADLQSVIQEAKAVEEKGDEATQDEINLYILKLSAAIEGLKLNIVEPGPGENDKEALAAELTVAGKLIQAEYTDASWTLFDTAYKAASAVNDNAEATQEEIDAALGDLTEAADALVVRGSEEELDIELAKLTLSDRVSAAEIALPNENTDGFALSWESDHAAIAVDNEAGKGTVTRGESDATVKLTATITAKNTIGENEKPLTKKKEFMIVVPEIYLAASAKVTASYSLNTSLTQINDEISTGTDRNGWNGWRGSNVPETDWIQYEFPNKLELTGSTIRWFDNDEGVVAPASIAFEYYDIGSDSWKEILPADDAWEIKKDADSVYTFEKIVTDKIKLLITNGKNSKDNTLGAYICEWGVTGKKWVPTKADLQASITAASAYAAEDYTEESYAELAEVIEAAQTVAAKEAPTAEEITEAMDGLQAAIAGLELKLPVVVVVDKTVLEAAIAKAPKEADKKPYMINSWKAYEKILNDAIAVSEEDEPIQTEVDDAATSLNDAAAAMTAYGAAMQKAQEEEGNESKYTPDSWAALSEAAKSVDELERNTNATMEDVKTVTKALNDAAEGLTLKEPEPVTVDKTALAAAIAKAPKEADKDKYTQDSWKKMSGALAAANTANSKADATQDEVNKAIEDLETAIKGLVEKAPSMKITRKNKSLVVGETFSVKAAGCTYSTSNKSVATVSKGKVTAKKVGKAVIKATNKSKNTETQYTITVKKAPSKIAKVTYKVKGQKKAKTISLKKNKGTITLKKGKSATLNPTLPSNTFSKFKYTLSGKNAKKIASVSAKGVVKAKKKGTVKVKIQTLNKKSVTITIKIK